MYIGSWEGEGVSNDSEIKEKYRKLKRESLFSPIECTVQDDT